MRSPIPIPYSVNPLNRFAGIGVEAALEGKGQGKLPDPRISLRQDRVYFSSGILEPSVAQPPLPLHEFLPLQPLSLDLQPPLPAHEFCPLQACFSFTPLSFLLAFPVAALPAFD